MRSTHVSAALVLGTVTVVAALGCSGGREYRDGPQDQDGRDQDRALRQTSQLRITTGVLYGASVENAVTSALYMRTQPWLAMVPILDASFVPWM
jgi:hypothetical protein